MGDLKERAPGNVLYIEHWKSNGKAMEGGFTPPTAVIPREQIHQAVLDSVHSHADGGVRMGAKEGAPPAPPQADGIMQYFGTGRKRQTVLLCATTLFGLKDGVGGRSMDLWRGFMDVFLNQTGCLPFAFSWASTDACEIIARWAPAEMLGHDALQRVLCEIGVPMPGEVSWSLP
jgi:hypothetical protein